jgi:Peptidase family S41
MKKLLTLFLIISNAAYTQSIKVDTLKVRQDYEKLISNLELKYVYYTQKNVDIECLENYYSNRIKTLTSETDVLLFFEYLLDEFYDSHLHLNSSNQFSYRLYSPIFATTIGSKIEISSVWKDQIESGVNINITNAEILTFNGVEFNQVIEKFPTHCQNKNNTEIRTWISNKILSGRYNEPRIITLKTTAGKIETLDIDKIKIRKDTTLLSYKIVDNIGIIRLNNSLGETKSKREFKQVLKKLKNTDGIILDLRNTVDGGSTNIANPIAGHFTNKKLIFQKYKNTYKEFVDHIKPKNPRFDNPLVVLVGRWTGSMGEGLASGFDGTGIGTIVGTEMQKLAGATKDYKFNYIHFGYQAPYIEVLHINGTPRQKLVPKYKVQCNDNKADEFIKEGIRIIKENNR